jgi:hypothetical protein
MKAVEADLEVLTEVAWRICYKYGSGRALHVKVHALERNMFTWLVVYIVVLYIHLPYYILNVFHTVYKI